MAHVDAVLPNACCGYVDMWMFVIRCRCCCSYPFLLIRLPQPKRRSSLAIGANKITKKQNSQGVQKNHVPTSGAHRACQIVSAVLCPSVRTVSKLVTTATICCVPPVESIAPMECAPVGAVAIVSMNVIIAKTRSARVKTAGRSVKGVSV